MKNRDAENPVRFVGAGPGAPDLITVRGKTYLEEAEVLVYTGSLIHPALLDYTDANCKKINSATRTLPEILAVMIEAVRAGKRVVRLHTGDPSLYGAIREQMDALDKAGIAYTVCPGVSAAFGAAASLQLEYTLPGLSQSLIVTRMEGRTAVPDAERIEAFAAHRSTMAIYLSAGMLEELSDRLLAGGYPENTPAAIVYKATWPEEERCCFCTVRNLARTAAEQQIRKTALILVGEVLGTLPAYAEAMGTELLSYQTSKLYDAQFTTEYRDGK